MQFKLHIHDDLMAEIERDGLDPREVLRDRMSRHLKRRFPKAPWFFFIMEDLTKAGGQTRPHAHGSIEIPRAPVPLRGKGSRTLKKMALEEGLEKAEFAAGWAIVVKALKAAGGAQRPRIAVSTGKDQARNLWRSRPYHPLFNAQYTTYAFKHVKKVSPTLGDRRLVLPYELLQEAKRLWELFRVGDVAVDQWENT